MTSDLTKGSPAGDSAQEWTPDRIQARIAEVPHWHHIIEFPHGIRSPGAYDPRDLSQRIGLGDLAGKRVLDVGTRDGFFAFEAERRGAEVVAMDHSDADLTGFPAAKEILGSRVEYVQANVYDISPEAYGQFDVVLFLGVIYHLRHPLLALDRLRSVCRGDLIVESLVCDNKVFYGFDTSKPLAEYSQELCEIPVAQFLEAGRFHADWTNKWSPNLACLRALLKDANFEFRRSQAWDDRALVHAKAIDDPAAQRWIDMDSGLRARTS